MSATGHEDQLLQEERGAALLILGLTMLFLAFVLVALFRGQDPLPHGTALALILFATVAFLAGGLGLVAHPLGTRAAGLTYVVGGLLVAVGAAVALHQRPDRVALPAAIVALPLVGSLHAHGLALLRGILRPARDDPLVRRLVGIVGLGDR